MKLSKGALDDGCVSFKLILRQAADGRLLYQAKYAVWPMLGEPDYLHEGGVVSKRDYQQQLQSLVAMPHSRGQPEWSFYKRGRSFDFDRAHWVQTHGFARKVYDRLAERYPRRPYQEESIP